MLFTITLVLQGGKLTTWYFWNFNDTTAPVNVTGFSAGANQSHVFAEPGDYRVSVLASNAGGSSITITPVRVFGKSWIIVTQCIV